MNRKTNEKKSIMLTEIHEQSEALANTFCSEKNNILKFSETINKLRPRFIMLVARGSSDNAATYAKYIFEGSNGIPCLLAAPSVITVYKKKLDLSGSVVIGISQSGEGTDINEVLNQAQKQKAYTIGITNSAGSAMTKVSDSTILLKAGKEKALAATKTYTCQLMSILMLSTALKGDMKAYNLLEDVPKLFQSVLKLESDMRELSCRYRYMEHCVIIGRGFNYCTVKEAALKFMETGYIVAQPFSTADFMHGPIAMTGSGFPVFVCAATGRMSSAVRKLIADLSARQAETIVMASDKKMLSKAVIPIQLPENPPEMASPLLYIVPFQFLACFIAQAKGIDPDNPRYLSKVTQTR
jgi:glutamine---fructose-6-phosphate transaminase (isomerizing)